LVFLFQLGSFLVAREAKSCEPFRKLFTLISKDTMPNSFWDQLDATNDAEDVRRRIAAWSYREPQLGIAKEWIAKKERARQDERTARAEAREEESLSIAREALDASAHANRIAIFAIVVSIVTAIAVALFEYFGA
jgi:hypothetical protein